MSSPTPPDVATPPPRRGFGAKRVILLVLGTLVALIGLSLLAAGGAGAWALGERDSAGYFKTGTHRLATTEYALASENLDVDSDVPGWFGDHFATVRIQATSEQPVFIGIARTSEIDRYLDNVPHDEITDVDADPFDYKTRRVDGRAVAARPTGQSFWRVQASGPGTQTIKWSLESGDWSAVAMNADASRGVSVDARFGIRVKSLVWLMVIGFVVGALILLGGAAMIYFGARRPRPASPVPV